MKVTKIASLMILAICLLAGCKSSQSVQKNSEDVSSEVYKQKVLSNNQTAKAITAKMKLGLVMGDKNISLGGNLKMMRDEVIQLSLSFLGMEVGRMEFAKESVLIIDRVHRQYARVPYTQIDFLKSANLDFYALQALFWNEIFVPGQTHAASSLSQFSVASSGAHTLLSLKSAPLLDYSFLTVTSSALLNRTSVSPKNLSSQENLECRYDAFVKLDGHSFPSVIKLTFKGPKTYTLDMALSNLDNSEKWTPQTNVSSKYTPMNVNSLLDKLMIP